MMDSFIYFLLGFATGLLFSLICAVLCWDSVERKDDNDDE